MFLHNGEKYAFARWGRPIAPVVFGVEDQTLAVVKGAFEAVCRLADHPMEEVDPELGANCMMFFLREWDELLGVPDLDHLVPDIDRLVDRLRAADASQYRAFRFDDDGAIRAAFVFLRMRGQMAEQDAEELALTQAVQVMLAWAQTAFQEHAPLAVIAEATVLRPEIADLIRAAYDPAMPSAAGDASHALRLFARMQHREGRT